MNNIPKNITGAILAGGQSTRMGQDKALLTLNGKSFIQRIAEELQKIFTDVIVISDIASGYDFLHLPVYGDIYKNCGPLSGIHSALVNSNSKSVFIVSVDLPLANCALMEYIIDRSHAEDTTLLSVDDRIQPLFGLYNRTCLPVLINHLEEKQYSVQHFIKNIHSNILPASPRFIKLLFNINTRKDYLNLARLPH
jgi:molybdopterin-guanine dinucleotide biosynthesis protein A